MSDQEPTTSPAPEQVGATEPKQILVSDMTTESIEAALWRLSVEAAKIQQTMNVLNQELANRAQKQSPAPVLTV